MSTNSKAEIDRFGIVIIESLREGELQTGTKLYNDVLKPRCTADESMFCEYYRVTSNYWSISKKYITLRQSVPSHCQTIFDLRRWKKTTRMDREE